MVMVRCGKAAQNDVEDYKSECQGCHVPAKSTGWIYVNGYPAVRGGG